MKSITFSHAHLFCGLGGGAAGFNEARPDIGGVSANFRCIGGIDVDSSAIADFNRIAGIPGTVLDLFDRDQYRDFHGCEPPALGRKQRRRDIHAAFQHQHPHVVFLSAPCKGFSGLMSEGKSQTAKYQALNRLTLRGVWLMLEAYRDDPVEMILFENVPRIASRGRHLLNQIVALLRHYGYVVAETTTTAESWAGCPRAESASCWWPATRRKVPPFLYEPVSRPLQSVGAVLGRMPLAGDVERAGPMHRVPALQWKT